MAIGLHAACPAQDLRQQNRVFDQATDPLFPWSTLLVQSHV
jgi:hypothetical protein